MIIPQALVEAINGLGLSKINTGKAIKLADLILEDQRYLQGGIYDYVHLPVNYLQKVFTKDYYTKFFNAMKYADILEDNGIYKRGTAFRKGIAKGYRLNEKYLTSEFCIACYEDVVKEDNPDVWQDSIWYYRTFFSSHHSPDTSLFSSFSMQSSIPCNYPSFPKNLIYDDLGSLYYDGDAILEKVGQIISSKTREKLKIGEEVKAKKFEVNNRIIKKKYYTSCGNANMWAERNNSSLIQDGCNFYIDDLGRFIKNKKNNIRFRYKKYLSKMQSNTFYADRNKRNNRLDHDFTALSKAVLEVIKRDNDLVELDLSNSQFAIHAHWLRKEGLDREYQDVETYCDLCASGRLYELLSEKLVITRDEAKQLMMELAFSRQGNKTPAKELFRSRFPNVVAHIDGYKVEKTKDPRYKKNGYKEFAVELQKREAEMFIDNLYPNIKELSLFCLTKHDSLLFKRNDQDVVLAIVQEYFDHLDFQANYKVE